MTNQSTVGSLGDLFAKQHYGPVTALKIVNEFVIAGYGPTLKIFLVDDNKVTLVHSSQVFKRNKIHCFAVSGLKLAVAGARSFCIIDMKTFDTVPEKAINEWITTFEFLNKDTLLILNSHNTIYKISLSFDLIEKVHCDEKSILYSGQIRVINESTIYVAAGTVMDGVLIWDLNSKRIVATLTDHEGSIFGVQIDPTGQFVMSCSDDRSIKLYDFKSQKLLATGWGHGSRIWNLSFFKDLHRMVSFGEDCTVRVWKYDGTTQLVQERLFENVHIGKHIWSGDVDSDQLKLFVSGGADGKIRLHDLATQNETFTSYTLLQISEQIEVAFSKKEIVRQFVEVKNSLVLLTSKGTLFSLDQKTQKFSFLRTEEKLIEFGILNVLGEKVVVAARNGDLLILDENFNATWILNEKYPNLKMTNFLVAKSKNGYHTLTANPNLPFILRIFDLESKLVKTIELEQPEQTSFTTTDIAFDDENNWLILSSRLVSMVVYDLETHDDNYTSPIKPTGHFKKFALGDTISSISVISTKSKTVTLLITVRDGVYMYAELKKEASKDKGRDFSSGDFSLNIILKNKLSRGYVEGGYLQNNDLILFGFKSLYFYIWNETKQVELTNQLCGGIHRQWQLFRNGEEYKFAYINKSELFIKTTKERFGDNGVINDGTHGREIRGVTLGPNTETGRLLITASEDTTVKLHKLDSLGNVKTYWTLNNHVSGLQKVKFLDLKYVASCAANEEFFVWEVNYLGTVPVMKECARLQPDSEDPDLRIMDFSSFTHGNGFIFATVYSNSNIKIWYFDVKERTFELLADDFYKTCCILSVDFLELDGRTLLEIGSTDGQLTIWDVSFLKTFATTTAIEKAAPAKLGPILVNQQLHQNGIKANLAIKDSNGYKIITGGDDNSLILSKLKYSSNELTLVAISFVAHAASSVITSISKAIGDTVVVTSVDQIVRKWSYDADTLTCVAEAYTTIADTGCSDSVIIDDEAVVVVGGAGLSVWSCK